MMSQGGMMGQEGDDGRGVLDDGGLHPNDACDDPAGRAPQPEAQPNNG